MIILLKKLFPSLYKIYGGTYIYYSFFFLTDNIKLKTADLEKQLLSTDDPQKIREVIIKLVETSSIRPVHQINCKVGCKVVFVIYFISGDSL